MVSILALFYLATYLTTFQKIGQFFPNHLITLLVYDQTRTFNIIKMLRKSCHARRLSTPKSRIPMHDQD
jgi:hypothetical protein